MITNFLNFNDDDLEQYLDLLRTKIRDLEKNYYQAEKYFKEELNSKSKEIEKLQEEINILQKPIKPIDKDMMEGL